MYYAVPTAKIGTLSLKCVLVIRNDGDSKNYPPPPLLQTHGENYFQRREGFQYVVLRGPGVVEVRQQPVVVLKMGFVAEADFFESDVLNRLADLLEISPSQLRVVSVVREASRRRRRRRETAQTEVEVGPCTRIAWGN